MNRGRRGWIVVALVLCIGLFFEAVSAQADTFDLVGWNDPNLRVEVTFDVSQVTHSSLTYQRVDVTIKNSSINESDPRLTGFAFNLPDAIFGFIAFGGPSFWGTMVDRDNIGTPEPLGKFDVAAITGPNFSGGDPNFGIPVGQTGSFYWQWSPSSLPNFTPQDFLGLLSAGGQNDVPQYFAARFQRTGLDGKGSDVAVPGEGLMRVPEPETIVLLGIALVAFAVYGLYMRKKRKIK